MIQAYYILTHPSFRYVFAAIWFVNGLFAKVLGHVPRHERIVTEILGEFHADTLTMLLGIVEVCMAGWIVSGWRYGFCAAAQIALILVMNLIEFLVAPQLLLWGKLNLLFAIFLVAMIAINAFGPQLERRT